MRWVEMGHAMWLLEVRRNGSWRVTCFPIRASVLIYVLADVGDTVEESSSIGTRHWQTSKVGVEQGIIPGREARASPRSEASPKVSWLKVLLVGSSVVGTPSVGVASLRSTGRCVVVVGSSAL